MNLVLWDILCHQFMPYSIINALGGLTVYIYCVQCKIVYICAWCHIIIIGILFISLFFFLDQGLVYMRIPAACKMMMKLFST